MSIIRQFNEVLPSIQEIIKKFESKANINLGEIQASEYLLRMKLVRDDNLSVINGIEGLIINTNIDQVGVGSINFYSEVEEIGGNNISFADFNEEQFIFSFNRQKEIFVNYGDTASSKVMFENQDDFLRFLIFYNKLHYDYFYRNMILSKEDSEKVKYFLSNDLSETVISEILYQLPSCEQLITC